MYNSIQLDGSPAGLAFAFVVYIVVAFAVSTSRIHSAVKWLIWAGLALRIVGAYGRETIKADAVRYYRFGALHADRFSNFDLSPFWDQSQWWGSEWIGTNFVTYPAGLFISLVGENMMAVFLLFSLVGFAGVAAFGRAFQNSLPMASSTGYWAWLCLFPSLWFWPSSLGKEALMIFGLGYATLSYLRKDDKTRWVGLVVGLAIVFAIRPQVVAVYIVAMILASFLEFNRWTPIRTLQAIVLIVAGLSLMWFSLSFAVENDGAEGVSDYIATNAENSTQGGSSVGAASLSPLGVLTSIMNVLFRPFFWEAHNLAALMSAVEVTLMWGIIFARRNQIAAIFRVWRDYRATRFAVAFTLLYVVALGFSLGNLGIIARQRVLVFPLFFLIIEAGSMLTSAQERRRMRIPQVPRRYGDPRQQRSAPSFS